VRGDEMLTELMSSSGDRLLRLAYQLCHERAGAEDIVQEALARVYGSWLRRPRRVEFAEAYMRRAIVNEYLRRSRLRASAELVTDDLPERAYPGFADAVAARDEIWRALSRIPARQRTVLVLRYYEDLADSEIARLIGAKEATVRSLTARGLTALRVGNPQLAREENS